MEMGNADADGDDVSPAGLTRLIANLQNQMDVAVRPPAAAMSRHVASSTQDTRLRLLLHRPKQSVASSVMAALHSLAAPTAADFALLPRRHLTPLPPRRSSSPYILIRSPFLARSASSLQARIQSAKELCTIATALGPERTRDELLPFLIGCIDEDDEVADAICDELVKFGPLVGGEQYIHALLPPLEAIAAGEEMVTRTKAVNGLAALAKQMPVANMLHCILPMIERLAKGHWYTQRASSCGLFHIVYPVADPAVQRQLLEWIKVLSVDQAAMVRRSVAENLETLIPMVDKVSLSEILHPVFLQLAQDEQVSIAAGDPFRVTGVPRMPSFARQLRPAAHRAAATPFR